MSEVEFNRYNNIITFAREWRKYDVVSNIHDKESFRKDIQSNQYIKIECSDKKQDRTVLIYLFDKNSKYVTSSTDMKSLLHKIKNPCHVILITYQPLNVYHKKAIASQKHLRVNVYRHEIFDLVIPDGPLCYPHRIMSKDEVLHLTNEDLCCGVINLPKIMDDDPQCIWIGAEVGDVIEIKMLTDITGETLMYRVVIPRSGKVIAQKTITQEEEKEEIDEDDDDEIQEKREEIDDDENIESDEEQSASKPRGRKLEAD